MENNAITDRGKYVEYAAAREAALHYAASVVTNAADGSPESVVPLAQSFLDFLVAGPLKPN